MLVAELQPAAWAGTLAPKRMQARSASQRPGSVDERDCGNGTVTNARRDVSMNGNPLLT
jgi:hypothetical protein